MTTASFIWFLAIGALFYFMMKYGSGCCGGHGHSDHGEHHPDSDAKHGGREHSAGHHDMQRQGEEDTNRSTAGKDPVCGMEVNGKFSTLTSEYLGRTFYFCSGQCKKRFDLYPDKYI